MGTHAVGGTHASGGTRAVRAASLCEQQNELEERRKGRDNIMAVCRVSMESLFIRLSAYKYSTLTAVLSQCSRFPRVKPIQGFSFCDLLNTPNN